MNNLKKEMSNLNFKIIEQLIKDKKFKLLCEIFSFAVLIEKNKNTPILECVIENNKFIFKLSAIYWRKNAPYSYKKISVKVKFAKNEICFKDKKMIKKYLIEQIYYQIIKKEIMMI